MSDPDDPGGSAGSPVILADEQDAVEADAGALVALAEHALLVLEAPTGAELSVTLVDEARIAELKGRYLGRPEPTDVLSFPVDEPGRASPGPVVLGEVAICPAFARRQSAGLGRGMDEELALLLVHGILHLLGRDHDEPDAERAMSAEERRVMASFRARAASGAGR